VVVWLPCGCQSLGVRLLGEDLSPSLPTIRGQLPSSLREKFLYQHVSIYLHAGMFVCLFVCLFVRPLYYFFQKANNVLYFCSASATQAMLV
jgi:hypothetical protein